MSNIETTKPPNNGGSALNVGLCETVREYLRPHYLLHVILDEAHANVHINTSLGKWVADKKRLKSRIVVVQAWRISVREYLQIKSA